LKRTRTHLQVPPYFPEPEVVSDNIAASAYPIVLGFTRRVILGHAIVAAAIAAVAVWFPLPISLTAAILLVMGGLLLMTVLRRLTDGGPADNIGSMILLVPTLVGVGTVLSRLHAIGWPVEFLVAVPATSLLYAAGCGRDFSFPGLFVLASMATVAVGVALPLAGVRSWIDSLTGMALAVTGIAYFTYDLAALLRRRRIGEEPAAVGDLYRDLLNFLTYSVRVILHWRKFRFI